MEKREQVFVPALQDVGRSEEGAAWRFAGYQGRVWDGVTDGYGWDGGARYQGLMGLARVGVELSGNIISNYRTFECERSERTYNFDYVKRKRMDRRLMTIDVRDVDGRGMMSTKTAIDHPHT